MTIFGKYIINHTKTVCQVQERLLSLASCIIYISLIVYELYCKNLVKHVNFYIARYAFDGHIMSRQEVCLGQLNLAGGSLCVFCFLQWQAKTMRDMHAFLFSIYV